MKKKKKLEELEELFTVDDIHEFSSQLTALTDFVNEGQLHGTLIEALMWVIRDIKENPGMSLEEILYNAASEWYK